jgi:hypothetical protein
MEHHLSWPMFPLRFPRLMDRWEARVPFDGTFSLTGLSNIATLDISRQGGLSDPLFRRVGLVFVLA